MSYVYDPVKKEFVYVPKEPEGPYFKDTELVLEKLKEVIEKLDKIEGRLNRLEEEVERIKVELLKVAAGLAPKKKPAREKWVSELKGEKWVER